ncbi:agmatine coumaroyltransferase-2-like [Magnolia sinica]|uniref:agmatine coumaroyltransferase-2-like n=1 Tax=Magnolia sinica TaxID=86752 RepID=UPI002658A404|nr:agmatine coumaroyltransferase-2-like [Magnolia sinica]
MKVCRQSTKIVKPCYEGNPPPTSLRISLSVFDIVTFDTHIAVIYVFKPPTPSNATVEQGLRTVLAEYREWAGRLGRDEEGHRVIFLSDEGVRLVEATVDCTLAEAMPFKPSSSLLNLHPNLKGVEELMQVQLTRFTCGSMVLGFTSHHMVADGHSTSNFLIAWGRATRGLEMEPLPLHDRAIFAPRDPPRFEFEHSGVEFTTNRLEEDELRLPLFEPLLASGNDDNIIVHKAHFTLEFLSKLKVKASSARGTDKPYTTFESLVAHLWRTITKARGLNGFETTHVRISENGRSRLRPRVPNEYFGNLVLWAFPQARVKELLQEPLQHAAKLIHDSITNVDDSYFKSFIDFASSKEEDIRDLVPTANMSESVLSPNMEVDSWLRFPFYDLDFGGGSPFVFMPSYFPVEGMLFLLPSFIGDGSIDAIVPLFEHSLVSFKKACYCLD